MGSRGKRKPRKAAAGRHRASAQRPEQAEGASPSPAWLRLVERQGKTAPPAVAEHGSGRGKVALLIQAGQWSTASCGCSGPWTQKGDGLYWRPIKLCPAHAGELETFVHGQGVPIPGAVPHVQPDAGGLDVWPLPCRACGAPSHALHCWDCVFWAVNNRTPFDHQHGVTE